MSSGYKISEYESWEIRHLNLLYEEEHGAYTDADHPPGWDTQGETLKDVISRWWQFERWKKWRKTHGG